MPYIGRGVKGRYSASSLFLLGENSTMHLGLPPSRLERGRAEGIEESEPLAMASAVVVLCRRIKACVEDAIAIARWGYSRMRIWLDFSGDGAWPLHRAADGWL